MPLTDGTQALALLDNIITFQMTLLAGQATVVGQLGAEWKFARVAGLVPAALDATAIRHSVAINPATGQITVTANANATGNQILNIMLDNRQPAPSPTFR